MNRTFQQNWITCGYKLTVMSKLFEIFKKLSQKLNTGILYSIIVLQSITQFTKQQKTY